MCRLHACGLDIRVWELTALTALTAVRAALMFSNYL